MSKIVDTSGAAGSGVSLGGDRKVGALLGKAGGLGGKGGLLSVLAAGVEASAARSKKMQEEWAQRYAKFTPSFHRLIHRNVNWNDYPVHLKILDILWTQEHLKIQLHYKSDEELK